MWEIIPGKLWQGSIADVPDAKQDIVLSCVPALDMREVFDDFRAVLNLSTSGRLHAVWPIEDGPLPDMEIAHRLASFIAHELAFGKTALIHCMQGANRSGLLCGLTVYHFGAAKGPAIVAMIHQAHPSALFNDTFCKYLDTLT